MNIVTMQSFDDNIMQMSWEDIRINNSKRFKEMDDEATAKGIKSWEDFCKNYSKEFYSQPAISSLLEALRLAEKDLFEAADKFWVMHCNMSHYKYDSTKPMHENRKWENREFAAACSARAGNAADAIRKLINSMENPKKAE